MNIPAEHPAGLPLPGPAERARRTAFIRGTIAPATQKVNFIVRGRSMKSSILGLGLAAILAATTAFAQQPIVIKFSHVVTNDTPKGKGALKFKELAEKYTNGKVKVEVYPNSQLFKDKEEIEALQLGSVQMLAPSTAKFRPIGVPEFEALDLPWLFKDEAAYSKAMKGPVGQWLFKKLEPKGIT